ncbi:polyadenylate-binding protein-interacting protein 7-like [Phoenix dactylifera]|uniref:Polyadenylate-binding protein-interacting protein 7-like n=1 Tax=Phoenix dactylifera TaxID=42345 RepID=A0A8B7C6S2_PHODC|nr:polyadenylate-binding protein-interacting protein 7-like [Phoenix dactylifera]
MSLPIKVFSNNKDARSNIPNKMTALNPNAAEFVPSALRSKFGISKSADATKVDVPGPSGKEVLNRSESNVSNNSDDEAHQFWCHQLPDDITPDFKVMGEDELQSPGQLSLAGLSIHDGIESSQFSASTSSWLLGTQHDVSSFAIDNINSSEKTGSSGSSYAETQPLASFMALDTKNWNESFINGDQHFTSGRHGHHYNGDYSTGFLTNSSEDAVLEDGTMDPLGFLASQFPGFAAESLADVYYANGCDLNSTIEILTQLEMQVDCNFGQNLNSKSSPAPSLSMLDFPALPMAESKYNEEGLQQTPNSYRSPSSITCGTVDFASAVRKFISQDSGHWKYERSGSADGSVGSSRGPQLLTNQYNGNRKSAFGDKLHNAGAARAAPAWLETGEAVANMYSELREEARDFARLRNACFEQARQAYLVGNKALAKELSVKGQLYNMQMKAAHAKAREKIFRQRNPVAPQLQGQAQDCMIDLHGLHVSEAIHILKQELSILRSTARSAGQQLQVMICVGTGHHTKGSRTPARLPVAVEQYLIEEGLHYTQPQPGLLRVVIY